MNNTMILIPCEPSFSRFTNIVENDLISLPTLSYREISIDSNFVSTENKFIKFGSAR